MKSNSIDYLESIRHQHKTEFMQLGNLAPCTNENEMDVISEDEDLQNVEDTEI